MVHWWQDPAVEARLTVVYVNSTFLLLGIHGWEYFRSFGVEYAIIRGRLPLSWPLIPYLLGRLFLLTTLILLAIETSPLAGSFTCQSGILWTAISGGIAIGSASANLMIRTWVIWKDSRLVHLLLSILALGQWTVLAIDTANIRAVRSNGTCVVYLTHSATSAGVFMYTVCYDFLVLILSVIKLSRLPSKSPLMERLRTQGLLYFAVAAMANVLPTVFAFLGYAVMVGITGNLAIVASTIVSCKVVRSLLYFRDTHPSHTSDENAENNLVLTTQLPCQTTVASMGVC